MASQTMRVPLLPHQYAAWTAKEPYVALVTGLGGGKTWYGARWVISRAVRYPHSVHLSTANSYRQAWDVLIPEIRRALDEMHIPYTWKATASKFELHLGETDSQILVRSTDKPNLLRGLELGSWHSDETRDCSQEAAETIFGRLRCKQVDRPKYLFTTTPSGFNSVIYRWHVESQDPDYRLIQAPSQANWNLPASYVGALKCSYDEQLARQELGGEFVNLGAGNVYRAFDRTLHVKEVAYNTQLPLLVCWDFGIDPLAVVIAQDLGTEVHALREVTIHGEGIYAACDRIKERFPNHLAGIHVHGDAAGTSRTAETGRTHYALVREGLSGMVDIYMRHGRSNPPVRDRINAVNSMLKNRLGQARLFVHPRCKELIKDLEQVVWTADGSAIDKRDHARTHHADAISYFIWKEHRPSAFRRASPGDMMRLLNR